MRVQDIVRVRSVNTNMNRIIIAKPTSMKPIPIPVHRGTSELSLITASTIPTRITTPLAITPPIPSTRPSVHNRRCFEQRNARTVPHRRSSSVDGCRTTWKERSHEYFSKMLLPAPGAPHNTHRSGNSIPLRTTSTPPSRNKSPTSASGDGVSYASSGSSLRVSG